MGGKALLGKCEIKPLNSWAEYSSVYEAANRRLSASAQDGIYRKWRKGGTPYVRTLALSGPKVKHSDIDFIIKKGFIDGKEVTEQSIADRLGSKAFVRNGDVISYEFDGHQLDFIEVPPNALALNAVMKGHGGAGFLLKHLVKPYGLSIQDGGLFFRLEYEGKYVDDLLKTADSNLVLNVCGTDQYLYSGSFPYGFRELEASFPIIKNSPFFTYGAFGLKKRGQLAIYDYVGKPEYMDYPPFKKFVEFLQETKGEFPEEPTEAQWKFMKQKLFGSTYGQEFDTRVKRRLETYQLEQTLRNRFNGEMVMEVTGLQAGPAVGKFMEAFRMQYPTKDKFYFFVLSNTLETIKTSIRVFFKNWAIENSALLVPVPELIMETKPAEPAEIKDIPPLVAKPRTRKKVSLPFGPV